MDPIQESRLIFSKIAKMFPKDELKDLGEVGSFFDALIAKTDGLIVVDFLDQANWDCLASYDIDRERGFLFVYWHDYRDVDSSNADTNRPDRFLSPASLYGLFMHFHSLKILRTENYPVFFLQGYALTDKQIRKILSPGTEKFELEADAFFSRRVYRKINEQWQVVRCLNTPIHSVLIIPKRSGLSRRDSKFFLYNYNVSIALERLKNLQRTLSGIVDDDIEQLCEKANTIRRILENILKVECCYREVEFNKPYSKLRLGDLLKSLKGYHDEINITFSKVAEWTNELSHDSGVPVQKQKVESLCLFCILYTELFRSEMDVNYRFPRFRF